MRTSAAKGLVQNPKSFQPTIDSFLPSFWSLFDLFCGCIIQGVPSYNLVLLANVSFIANGHLTRFQFRCQTIWLVEHLLIVFPCRKRSIDLNYFIMVQGQCDFVGQGCLLVLWRIPSSGREFSRFPNSKMDAIHTHNIMIVKIIVLVENPLNL